MATAWYQLTTQAAVEQLGSDATRGLEQADVRRRVEQHGPNALRDLGGRGAWHILWEQLSSSMVLLLLVAAAVSVILGETTDTVVILAIVVLNAALGFFQDYRAERALAALKRLSAPVVRVRRDGKICELSARELVPGDIVQLEVGNYVPADCRILESVNLKLEEAALTGESTTVDKHTEPLHDDELALGDRHNMAFMGTVVTFGHGQGLVTATGMQTELGKIAESLQSVKAEATPLQKRLAQLGRWLAVAALGIVILVFVVGVLRGEDPRLMLLTALSMAVAIVPEGLPAVATVSLALGARRMFAKRALIRKLPAVETLGSVSVICSDKTGTLTENRMTLTLLDVAGERLNIAQGDDEEGAAGAAERSPPQTSLEQHVADNSALALLLAGAGLCNDATLQNEAAEEGYVA
ncbi:MAG: HAD-IC family P-type ATPase, partial [Planctomycetales bacterium]|nr:HAD-IC family P-type ATPase [Planctomycetales bacterium]